MNKGGASASSGGVRWLRALLIGLAAEVALSVVVIPFALMRNGVAMLNFAIVPASFLVFIAFGYWSARPLFRQHAPQGLLTGLFATLLYYAFIFGALSLPGAPPTDWSKYLSPAYLLADAGKLVGGTIGGLLVARKMPAA